MNKKILIIEDDDNLRTTLSDNLQLEGYCVESCALVKQAQQFLTTNTFDLIILDIMLPDGNGYNLCKWIREKTDVFILMLTARSLEKDVIEGFISGADDYLSKPYRSTELFLRIKALLKRKTHEFKLENSDINGFNINWNLRTIKANDEHIHLTKTAFDILQFLHLHINLACSREDILNAVWGKDVYVANRTVDNFVSNLKKQLNLWDGENFHIKTIRGIGYSLIKNPN